MEGGIGSIRTSVVQHPRVWYSAPGLLPGSCAATARPRRMLPCVLAASARPNCRNRSPSYRSRSRLLDGSGGCCPGSRCGRPGVVRTGRRLLRRQPRGSCLGRAAPASGGPLKLGRANRVAASIGPQVGNRLPRPEPPAAAAPGHRSIQSAVALFGVFAARRRDAPVGRSDRNSENLQIGRNQVYVTPNFRLRAWQTWCLVPE